MPFLIIIAVGVIIVLLFNLFKAVFAPETSGDAFLHLESGSVQVKMFGTDDYFSLTSDALVMQGDELVTSADSKVIIEFFDGTVMRLAGGTDIVLEQIDDGDEPYVNLMLVDGKLWFNKFYKGAVNTDVEIKMSNVVVKSGFDDIFEVESDFDEVVRVLRGDVVVDVLSQDGSRVVETEKVGVGQEIIFTDKILDAYWKFQSPSVLSALSDEFRQTRWYEWNIAEDESPTEFSKSAILGEGSDFVEVVPEVMEPEVGVSDDVEGEDVTEPEEEVVEEEIEEEVEEVVEEPEEEVDLGPLGTPTITSVAGITETNDDGFYVVTTNPATLTGGISGAEDVVVSGYTLQKFVAGDGTWTYYANADYALMEVGENSYEVYAVAPDGTHSASITVKVLYQPPTPVVEEEPVEEEVVEEESPVEEPT